jgi:hypothetical protein
MMNPSAFDTLLRRLCADERACQVELLLALVEFDRHELYLELGYDGLWSYCTRALHLREGATFRRIRAVKLLQRFPELAEPLRDGRLCLSTLVVLEPLLSEGNVSELVAQAAFKSKSETERLVASLKKAPPPPELTLRRAPRPPIPQPAPTAHAVAPAFETAATPPAPAKRAFQAQPACADEWVLRGRLSDRVKRKLEQARELASHAIPDGSWEAVLEAALDCYITELEKRRSARTNKPRAKITPPQNPRTISAEVRREVAERDQNCCAWRARDGRICQSRWQLEFDHIDPNGPSTVSNLRLLCRRHNMLHAEHIYGKDYMAQFRRSSSFAGESSSDESHQAHRARRRSGASETNHAPEERQPQLAFT